jgi:hypothetical protein
VLTISSQTSPLCRGSNHAKKPKDEENHDDRSERNGEHIGLLLKPWFHRSCVGLARRGRRRAKGPLHGWNKVGLDSYVDPDISTVSRCDSHKLRRIGYLEYQDPRLEKYHPRLVAAKKFPIREAGSGEIRRTSAPKFNRFWCMMITAAMIRQSVQQVWECRSSEAVNGTVFQRSFDFSSRHRKHS